MKKVSRRSAMRAAAAGAVAVGTTAVLGETAVGDELKAPKLWTLEGELKVHPKFIYRYYIVLHGGHLACALYGSDHGREYQDGVGRQARQDQRYADHRNEREPEGAHQQSPSRSCPTRSSAMLASIIPAISQSDALTMK